jgi:hypothetical protein
MPPKAADTGPDVTISASEAKFLGVVLKNVDSFDVDWHAVKDQRNTTRADNA